MEVKEATRTAKKYITDLFDNENIMDIGLEEIDFRSDRWEITIGFFRPWDHGQKMTTVLGDQYPARSYKVVSIDNMTGRVLSVMDRVLPPTKN